MPDAASARVRTWYPLKDPAGRDLVSSEIVDVILGDGVEPVTQTEKELRYAEVKRTLRQASDGQLSDGSWKPVSRDPELWELRWQWDDGSQLRGYFHEPPLEPDSTILAKVHRKRIIPETIPRPSDYRMLPSTKPGSGSEVASPIDGVSATAIPSSNPADLTPDIDSNL